MARYGRLGQAGRGWAGHGAARRGGARRGRQGKWGDPTAVRSDDELIERLRSGDPVPDEQLPKVLARWRRAVLAGEYRAAECVDPVVAMAVIAAARRDLEDTFPRGRVSLRERFLRLFRRVER